MNIHRVSCLFVVGMLLAGCSQPMPADKPEAVQLVAAATKASTPATCAFCPEPSAKECTLCVAHNPLLNVNKDGAASATVRLCNRSAQDVKLDLSLSDFHAQNHSGKPYPLSTVRTLSPVVPNNPVVTGASPLTSGSCVDVKADVSGLWQAGLSSAELNNGTERVIVLKAVRHQVPFNVRVDGPTPEVADVHVTRGKTSFIRLRNEDDMEYRVVWRLELGDNVRDGEFRIPARGLVPVPVELDENDFSFLESGFLRRADRSGTLVLTFEPDVSFQVLPLPQKRFPVTAHLSYFNDAWQRAGNYAFVLAVLLLGIMVSLGVNHLLPAQRKRVDIKQSLADLDGKLAGLGDVIDSRILNLLRLEKKRLREALRELRPWVPQTGVQLPKMEERIEWLVQRIDLTSRVGELLEGVNPGDGLAIPESDQIRTHCREVLGVVRKPEAAADDIARAREHVQQAEAIRDQAGDPPKAEALQALEDRATAVAQAIPNPLPQDPEWQACADVIESLRTNLPGVPAPERPDYVRKSKRVLQAELIVKFVKLVHASAGDEMRRRRLARADDLMKALKDGADQSTEKARDIVQQVEQNVTRADLLDEMAKAGSMRVEVDPPTPFAYQLVTFRVRFHRPGMDSAVAQDEIACEWYVNGERLEDREESAERCGHGPDGRHARGWLVGSYFIHEHFKWRQLPGRVYHMIVEALRRRRDRSAKKEAIPAGYPASGTIFHVEARFPDVAGAKVSNKLILERTRDYVESRTILAMASLLITVLIVAIGLLAGAQEKLQSLDWLSGAVAVLVLGFGADTLKTMLSKT
jgi:hypothetical protein